MLVIGIGTSEFESRQQGKTREVQEPAQKDSQREEHRARMERLFRDHNEDLIRFLRARLRSDQEAREVAQEAYVRLLSLDAPDTVSYLRAFLFKTAANIATDRKRRGDTHSRAISLPLFNEFIDTRTPERQVSGEQTLQRLQRLIVALPPKCQLAFVLHQIEGKDFAQIAEGMGLTESMVRKYVMRAWLHCRTRLDLEGTNAKR